MHPFPRIFFTMLITSFVGMWLLGILFRSGDETDRSVNECRDSWWPNLWMRSKFGLLITVVIITAIASFQGLPLLWQYLVAR